MEIGKEEESIIVEPTEDPFKKSPSEAPVEAPVVTPEKDKELVPA